MRLLLDTHAFVWSLSESHRLSEAAREAVTSTTSTLFVSSATAWEVATKLRIGKMPGAKLLVDDFEGCSQALGAKIVAINHVHALRAGLLEGDHRDPFDRMIIAQAQLEELHIVTRDPAFQAFDVRLLW